MGRKCCVLGCPSNLQAPFHTFPKNTYSFKKWKNAVYSSKIAHRTDEQLKKYEVVCYRHFKEEDYTITPVRRILRKNAVPTVDITTDMERTKDGESDDNTKDIKMEIAEPLILEYKTELNEMMNEICDDESKNIKMEIAEPPILEYKTEPNGMTMNEICDDESENINIKTVEQLILECEAESNVSVQLTDIWRLCKNNVQVETNTNNLRRKKFKKKNILGSRCSVKNLNVKEKQLYSLVQKLRKKQRAIQRQNLVLKERIKQAKKYAKSNAIEKLLKLLTSPMRIS